MVVLDKYAEGLRGRRAAREAARAATVTTVRTNLATVASMLRERYGVTRVVLFGSYARGDVRQDSDVDLLVDGLSGEDYFAAMADISRLLKRDVDLVRSMDASPLLLERIEQQGIPIDG